MCEGATRALTSLACMQQQPCLKCAQPAEAQQQSQAAKVQATQTLQPYLSELAPSLMCRSVQSTSSTCMEDNSTGLRNLGALTMGLSVAKVMIAGV
jgi:hypothetical protein